MQSNVAKRSRVVSEQGFAEVAAVESSEKPPIALNSPPGYAAQFWILFSKEMAVEFRSRETAVPMAVFAVAALITFQFSFDLRGATLNLVAPGVLWVAVIFASLLALGRSFAREVERGSLDGLLASPIDPGALYLAKVATNVVLLIVLEIVIVPLAAVLFNLQLFQPALLLTLILGNIGIASVGTILSAIAARARAREALLPIMLLPLLVPVIIGAVRATGLAIDGRPWEEIQPWMAVMTAYDLTFVVLSTLIFYVTVEK